MKKTTLALLLLIQIFSIFIFENIHSLLSELGKKEVLRIQEEVKIMSEFLVLKYRFNIAEMKKNGYFDRIIVSSGKNLTSSLLDTEQGPTVAVNIPVTNLKSVYFEKKLDSVNLAALGKLKNLIMGMIIILGIFLILTGAILVLRFKKSQTQKDPVVIPPLQNYLRELRGSEIKLKDIVARQEERVSQKDELNKNIINNINYGIIFLNKADKIEIFNSVAEELFDQSYSNAINNSLENILKDFPQTIDFIKKNLNSKADGRIESNSRIFYIDIMPLVNSGNLILCKEITNEVKREEIELRNKNFIMLGEMTAYLTHEIRNSLGVIYGYTKTLDEKSEKVKKINREIDFLTALMNSLLLYSRPVKTQKKKQVDLVPILEDIAAEHECPVKLSSKKVLLNSDPALLHSVFSNLVINSKESGAGLIRIDFTSAPNLEIVYSDNGSGINEKNQQKIWLPFYTTKDKGTGMGLAIIRKILSFMDGEISLISSKKGETRFKIVFFN